MTEGISWQDDTLWVITTTEADLPVFSPYHIGNGRIGVRVGPLVLDWGGDAKPLLGVDGPDFWGRLNPNLLMSLAKHVYDGGDQLILPAWNQARLEIGGVEYAEGNGRHRLRNTLDLRGGEATCEDEWEYLPGRTVTIRLRLAVPRGAHPCAAWYELALSGLTEPAQLRFGLNAAQIAETFASADFARQGDRITALFQTKHQGRMLGQGLRWEIAGWRETGFEKTWNSAWVTLTADGPEAGLVVAQSVHCSVDGLRPEDRVTRDLDALDQAGRENALEVSRERWHQVWARGLCFRHDNALWEKLVLVNQFHLLVNLEESGGYPLGPLGLSRPGWHGSQMWDADFWLFRAMLPLWPEFARNLVGFRMATIGAARANAKARGLRGACYTMVSTDEGLDLTRPPYDREIHINAWIGRAAWESAGSPPDKAYLAEVAWPLLEGVAEFFVSRAERDPDGTWHLRGVLPPDESVGEGPRTATGACDDNVLTNTGACEVLRYAMEAGHILGRPTPPEWAEMADHLLILPPGLDGIIPEYAGYNGHVIKQADLILAFYPWRLSRDPAVVLRNLAYYHEKTDRGGPLMTTQIEALLTMLHGERERGLDHLFKEYLRYVRGPHLIPFETPENSNSIMLTGIGGLLQALIYGWFGTGTGDIPRIGAGWEETAGLSPIENERMR